MSLEDHDSTLAAGTLIQRIGADWDKSSKKEKRAAVATLLIELIYTDFDYSQRSELVRFVDFFNDCCGAEGVEAALVAAPPPVGCIHETRFDYLEPFLRKVFPKDEDYETCVAVLVNFGFACEGNNMKMVKAALMAMLLDIVRMGTLSPKVAIDGLRDDLQKLAEVLLPDSPTTATPQGVHEGKLS